MNARLIETLGIVLILALVLEKFRPVLICLLLALAGWTNLAVHTSVISPDDLRNVIGNEPQIAAVRGTLIQTPQLKIFERGGGQTEHSLTQVRVAEIRRGENWRVALGRIIVATPGELPPDFFAGQSVEISGVARHLLRT